MYPLIEGFGLGLILAVLVGPIFFTILQVSIEHSWRHGLVLASGQWLGDIIYIGLVLWSAQYVQELLDDEESRNAFMQIVGLGGGILLILFGLFMAWPRETKSKGSKGLQINSGNMFWLFFQGFSINTFNPFPLFFWSSIMGSALTKSYGLQEQFLLFVGIMTVVVLSDGLKVYLSKTISTYIQDKHLRFVRLLAGSALVIFGFVLLLRTQF